MEPIKSSVWIPCDSLAFQPRPMNDFALFLGKFFRQGTAIASVAPSSRWLSETTVRNIDWGTVHALVELGAGTGPITRVIARHARPSCRVIVIERDHDFARLLSESISRNAQLRHRRGRRPRSGRRSLPACGIDRVDHVISGLARAVFSQGRCNRHSSRPSARSCGATGRTTRSPRFRGFTGRFTGGISTTCNLRSSRATCRRRGPIFVAASK